MRRRRRSACEPLQRGEAHRKIVQQQFGILGVATGQAQAFETFALFGDYRSQATMRKFRFASSVFCSVAGEFSQCTRGTRCYRGLIDGWYRSKPMFGRERSGSAVATASAVSRWRWRGHDPDPAAQPMWPCSLTWRTNRRYGTSRMTHPTATHAHMFCHRLEGRNEKQYARQANRHPQYSSHGGGEWTGTLSNGQGTLAQIPAYASPLALEQAARQTGVAFYRVSFEGLNRVEEEAQTLAKAEADLDAGNRRESAHPAPVRTDRGTGTGRSRHLDGTCRTDHARACPDSHGQSP